MQQNKADLVEQSIGASFNQKRKTVIRAYRIDEKLARRLSRAAFRAGVTENAFVTTILTRRVDVSPLCTSFGGIGLSKKLFREILGRANQSSIEMLASDIAFSDIPLAFGLLRLDRSIDSLIWFLKHILDATGWFHLEVEPTEEMIVTHDYGMKWSLFLKAYLASVFQLVLKEIPDISLEGEMLIRVDLSQTCNKAL